MPEPIAPPAPLLFKDLISEAGLADRAYLKDYADKPLDKETSIALLKKLDGAETLIGKRPTGVVVPGDDAKPEDIEAFLGKLRPAKPDDYEVKMGEKPDEEFIKEFRAAAHHAGLSKAQVARQLEKLVPVFEAKKKAAEEATVAREAEFDKMLKESLGEKTWDVKSKRSLAAIKELAPEVFAKFGDKLEDKHLVLLSAVVDAFLTKYAGEDDFKVGSEGGGGGGETKDSLTTELVALYSEPAWKDTFSKEHAAVAKRIDEILNHPVMKS